MNSESELMRLAVMAYEAGSAPSSWSRFLEAYARVSAADISLIQVHRFAEHRSEVIVSYGLRDRFRADYNNYYSKLNVWREHGQAKFKQQDVVIDPEVYPRPLLEKSEFYNDFLCPMRGVYTMAGVVNRDNSNAMTLTVLRDHHKGPWECPDKQGVELLLPHVRRACAIQRRLWIFQAGEIVLDGLPQGIVLFTDDERAVYSNRTAEVIFAEADGLSLKAGRLFSNTATTNATIQRAIRNAARMEFSPVGTEALLVERTSMRRSYELVVLPIRRQFPQFAGMGAPIVLVLITDPERQAPAATDLIRKLYGLTAKEAELAEKLAAGVSPARAAEEMNVRYETARTHLKRIYSKMGVSRQSELAALVARIPKV